MDNRRKRKAEEQLSPYSKPTEEEELNDSPSAPLTINRKKAKARIGKSVSVSNPESLKGVLNAINILKPTVSNDKISGLNRCFLKAVQTVVNTESNKDLSYLFAQYEKYFNEINKIQK